MVEGLDTGEGNREEGLAFSSGKGRSVLASRYSGWLLKAWMTRRWREAADGNSRRVEAGPAVFFAD